VFERCPGLRALLAGTSMQELADEALDGDAFPIAAILFDKRPGSNWAVGAHQDLAMPVAARTEAGGFTGWSTKGGVNRAGSVPVVDTGHQTSVQWLPSS
jgi:hypothetical protein